MTDNEIRRRVQELYGRGDLEITDEYNRQKQEQNGSPLSRAQTLAFVAMMGDSVDAILRDDSSDEQR